MRQGILILTFLLFFLLCKEQVQKDENEFSNYRKLYHVKTLTLEKNHPLYSSFGGIHHIYANEKAFQGYKNKTKFQGGSLIMFDLLELQNLDNKGEGKKFKHI